MKDGVYYRNVEPVSDIEAGALWKLEGSFLVLVDEDEFLRVKFEDHKDAFFRVYKKQLSRNRKR